jgi:ubiquinone/menaquinone biosynthesis C-methylase UbiE
MGHLEECLRVIGRNSPIDLLKAARTRLTKSSEQPLGSVRPLSMESATVFAEFETDDGRRIPLYEGYRDRIKARWRRFEWPHQALIAAQSRLQLDSEAVTLVQALQSGRTFPASWDDIADVVEPIAERYPAEFIRSDTICPLLKRPITVARMSDSQLDALAQTYKNQAASTLRTFRERCSEAIPAESMSVLETGCGMGHAVMAMANLGIGNAVGIDRVTTDARSLEQKPAISARLRMTDKAIADRVRILTGDIIQMPLADNAFDLICSASVFEHVSDLPAALLEMARVLKPGGIMHHNVDPFFSPSGGHALCTLDFPWGHARLSPAEFHRYANQFRPFEATYATDFFQNGFNQPRIPLHAIEQAIGAAGLSLLAWKEHWRSDHLPSGAIWQEISRIHPSIGLRDLAVDGLNMVLVKQ